MENLMIETLTQDIAALREQLSLINKRAEQIENNIELLKQHLEQFKANQCQQQESADLPEIEVELVVNDDDTVEAEEAGDIEETEQLLTEEEQTEETTLENEIITEIEQPAEQVVEQTQEQAKVEEVKEESKEKEDKPLGINLPPIDDIRKAISLGDRFLFQRELFQGDGEKMNKTIDSLNKLTSLDEAFAFINKKFDWDKESQAYELFTNILKRRY